MIIRGFRARIREDRIDDFKQLVRTQSIPWLENAEGMLGYFPGEPYGPGDNEFVMVTLWRDLASLEAFSGLDWANPVVTPDEAPLVEEMFAHHYLRFAKEEGTGH